MNKLENVTDDFLLLLTYMHERFFRPVEKMTRPQFSHAQFQAISILYLKGPLPMSELAGEMKISKQQATPLIYKLIDNSLAVRKVDEHDRRIVRIEITETGRSIFEELRAEIKRAFVAKLGVLPDMELDELGQMLKKTRKILRSIQ